MATKRLYQDDDHMTSFEASVVAVDYDARTIVLDATAFFPTGGHQHCDQGRIECDRKNYVVVTAAWVDDAGTIFHEFVAGRGELSPNDRVSGSIDAERRLRHMQLHTAQHVLSRIAAERFGIETGRAGFSPAGGLVVTEPALNWERALVLEDAVNRVIQERRAVARRVDDSGAVTVAIEGLDESRCCGTHVASTDEIGLFKITRLDGRSLHYETGAPAVRFAVRNANHAIETAARLELENTRELCGKVNGLVEAHEQAEARLERWKEETTKKLVATARRNALRLGGAGPALLQVNLSHVHPREARELVKQVLTAQDEVWICVADKRNLFVSSGTDSVFAHQVLEAFVTRWGMRGGGNARFAQGGSIPEHVAAPLDDVVSWLHGQHTGATPSTVGENGQCL